MVPNTALQAINVTAKTPPPSPAKTGQGLEIMFRPDPTIWDGCFANNGWLQELPKPQNKMTWDNAVWISPTTAQQSNLNTEDVVELKYQGRTVTGPVWIMPGHANDSVTVHLGYGRTRAGQVGNEVGFNAYLLRTSAAPDSGFGAGDEEGGRRPHLRHHAAHPNHGRNRPGSSVGRLKSTKRIRNSSRRKKKTNPFPSP